jgi:hypothetical protein
LDGLRCHRHARLWVLAPFHVSGPILNFAVAPFDGRIYIRTGWRNLGPGHNTVCHVPTEPWLPRLLSPMLFFGGRCPVCALLALFEVYQRKRGARVKIELTRPAFWWLFVPV